MERIRDEGATKGRGILGDRYCGLTGMPQRSVLSRNRTNDSWSLLSFHPSTELHVKANCENAKKFIPNESYAKQPKPNRQHQRKHPHRCIVLQIRRGESTVTPAFPVFSIAHALLKMRIKRLAILKLGNKLSTSFSSLRVRLVLLFEPISPRFVSFLLRRKLKEWKNEGLIDGYNTKTKRIGKFHYKIYLDLDLTSGQAGRILRDTLIQALKRIRRWYDGWTEERTSKNHSWNRDKRGLNGNSQRKHSSDDEDDARAKERVRVNNADPNRTKCFQAICLRSLSIGF